ncbi:MAG: hypothetical protein QM757_01620 [Paludibaculum sp.]
MPFTIPSISVGTIGMSEPRRTTAAAGISTDPTNAFTDDKQALHLRIAGTPGNFTCAQIIQRRSLGYGTYRFVVRDISHLEPAAVLALYTWEAASGEQNHREMDIEISRWGDPRAPNARYVLQPGWIENNTITFSAPGGVLTHVLEWGPGRAVYRTLRGVNGPAVFSRVFTSGVARPGDEKLRINFYDFQRGPTRIEHGAEVVLDSFEFIP